MNRIYEATKKACKKAAPYAAASAVAIGHPALVYAAIASAGAGVDNSKLAIGIGITAAVGALEGLLIKAFWKT